MPHGSQPNRAVGRRAAADRGGRAGDPVAFGVRQVTLRGAVRILEVGMVRRMVE